MCSYNRIGDVYACENPGVCSTPCSSSSSASWSSVMSDWGATHSTVPAANGGLDMEMNVSPGTVLHRRR